MKWKVTVRVKVATTKAPKAEKEIAGTMMYCRLTPGKVKAWICRLGTSQVTIYKVIRLASQRNTPRVTRWIGSRSKLTIGRTNRLTTAITAAATKRVR